MACRTADAGTEACAPRGTSTMRGAEVNHRGHRGHGGSEEVYRRELQGMQRAIHFQPLPMLAPESG